MSRTNLFVEPITPALNAHLGHAIEAARDCGLLASDSAGYSWRYGDQHLAHVLPPAPGIGLVLKRGGRHEKLVMGEEEDPVTIFNLSLHNLLRLTCLTQAVPAHGRARGFLARPRSAILFYQPLHEYEPYGLLLMRDGHSAHDLLEEIAAIESDFPGRFNILMPEDT